LVIPFYHRLIIFLPQTDRSPSYTWAYSLSLRNASSVEDLSAAAGVQPTLFTVLAAVLVAAVLMAWA
jgi:hypothetical protein